ncbi:MAG: transposase [Actinobacteria bacterium]|nr:transposase [Actinomycetota bacterium]
MDRRRIADAIVDKAVTGSRWRMLPGEFGDWNTI